MAAKKKKSYKVNIKGHDWTFHVQPLASYIRKHGSDSQAITYFNNYEVFFNFNHLNPEVVRHELMHCYVASSSTSSTNLTKDQVEELCSDIYGEHGPEMDALTDKILMTFLRE